MQIKTIVAATVVALSLGSLTQSAQAQNRPPSEAISSNARIDAMMTRIDRFQARQDRLERYDRYYVERQQPRRLDRYAARSTRALR
ncbi:hypothetical protein [Rhizorhabdus sp.]|uniref:hypothetical protein n=1 Tax=Rhizorhabdus sp. TaxID=1968843 RepID=UPI00198B8DC5|nr:hypothetical protein [Rhizorhabdus sp.]MBD3760750.1 hypothetical protein [Rhizorhabdus sp.]